MALKVQTKSAANTVKAVMASAIDFIKLFERYLLQKQHLQIIQILNTQLRCF
jgi:hypothetical protein